MSSIAKNCVVKCLKNPLKIIPLPDNVTVHLGRSKETEIKDPYMSRNQIAATANYAKREVTVEPLGTNCSCCNGYVLKKGKKYTLKHEDRLELIMGNYEFDVLFDYQIDDCAEPVAKRAKPNHAIFNFAKNSEKAKASINNNNGQGDGTSMWDIIDNGELLICTYSTVKSQSKVAAFDLDGTLIRTKSGARFAKNADDWVLNFSDVSAKLSDLIDKNYKIVIFTNQGGVKNDAAKRNSFKMKAEGVLSKIKVPIQLFAATTNSIYRKPVTGMWNTLCSEKNDQISVDLSESFYVGDAAGREKDWAPKKAKDHSLADRLFALNVGLKFYTPEEFFLGSRPVKHLSPKFDPKTLPNSNCGDKCVNECEVIVMVGSPGSGKSHFAKHNLVSNGYVHVNRDTLGSWQACVKMLEKSLQKNERVVIDNTNGDKTSRKRYIDVAKKLNVPCRCFVMTTSPVHCKHNNKFRQITDKTHVPVGEVILNMYKKNYEEPIVEEGFNEIVNVDFVPKFDNDDHEKLYKMFLLD
ncbi:hypothetical protein PPYR_15599 [Photinus pyralis]|uniref:PNK FHA domain-containing protein n=1 Tax=Photinus pyralis TaxID=7054 RepID=A0A5N3ZYE8_PHOPY|nr:uncharacterized protein F21D5.5-like [Photinus pyralis]KAB0790081.1 hypothetical protein PPYR_15599 [Photinus pyralis]